MTKKWQQYASPDDPSSYYDVDGVWPNSRGNYETADFLSGTTYTATGCGDPTYAWIAKPVSGADVQELVVATKIWSVGGLYGGGAITLTDVTNGVTVGRPQAQQFGNVTIMVMGSPQYEAGVALGGNATIKCTAAGGNFSALAGAPQGECIASQSGAIGIFNTDTASDGYAFSDVFDYTNWTTGEATSGRLYQAPGPIRAAVAFHDCIYVFKDYAIFRFRYVGGLPKWQVELVWVGVGNASGSAASNHNRACAGATGILFAGPMTADTGTPSTPYYWFDGVNPPILTNPFTQIGDGVLLNGPIIYNPVKDLFSVWQSGSVWYFSPSSMMWGRSSAPGAGSGAIPVQGDFAGRLVAATRSTTTECWTKSAADTLKRWLGAQAAGTAYLETMKRGTMGRSTSFSRAWARLRRRADLGTDSVTATLKLYNNLEDTSAATTRSGIAESGTSRRFDLMGGTCAGHFGAVRLTFTDLDVEVEDIIVEAKEAGTVT